MYDAAISPERRQDPEIVRLRLAINNGDQAAVADLFDILHKPMRDPSLFTLWQDNQQDDPNARLKIFRHFEKTFYSLTKIENEGAFDPATYVDDWDNLISDLHLAAERMWRDNFLKVESPREAKPDLRKAGSARRLLLDKQARTSRLLLFLWLEATLYKRRTEANSSGIELNAGIEDPDPRAAVRRVVREAIQEYRDTLARWDTELGKITGSSLFLAPAADFQRFRYLSREFGPDGVDRDEVGWAAQVDDAHLELRYQLFDERRRQYLGGHRYFSAAAYYVLRVTTGYGMRPMNFLRTVIAAILVFATLFFLNDFFNPGITSSQHFCPQSGAVDQMPIWMIVIRYLYLAVVNLASLASNGSVAAYCDGSATQVILILSALTGYFLLAILAALFFRLLTEAE
jgi:hypothetical protein